MGANKKIQISLVAALFLFCGASFAYTTKQDQSSVYAGLQLGYANMHYDKQWLLSGNNSINVGSVNNSGLAGRLSLGYDFSKNLGMEIGYVFLPKVKFNEVNVDQHTVSFDQNIIDICGKVTWPLQQYNVDLYGKAGVAGVTRDDLQASKGAQKVEFDAADTKTVAVIGAGVDYGFSDHVFADLSYMHYFAQDDLKPTDFVGIGMAYRF